MRATQRVFRDPRRTAPSERVYSHYAVWPADPSEPEDGRHDHERRPDGVRDELVVPRPALLGRVLKVILVWLGGRLGRKTIRKRERPLGWSWQQRDGDW